MRSGPNCVVVDDAIIEGDVSFGESCIVHPRAKILATQGPIKIGNFCIFEEYSTLENLTSSTLNVGDNNLFAVMSYVGPDIVGSNNEFRPRSSATGAIGSNCTVAQNSSAKDIDNVTVYGDPPSTIAHKSANDFSHAVYRLRQLLPKSHVLSFTLGGSQSSKT